MLHPKQKNTKKQLAIFSFCLILILLTGCVKQKQVSINNQKSEPVNKNEDKKNNTNIAENKDETDNVETNTKQNNEEEAKITWKKYTNSLYGFSFEYPDYLKITRDKENNNPFVPKGYWRVEIESADYKKQVEEESMVAGIDIISGFSLGVYANPSTDATTFEELKEFRQGGGDPPPIVKQETKESNSREFFVQTTQETFNDLHWSVSTLYKSNLSIGMGISGTKENKEEMEMILNHFIETFK